MCKIGGVVGIGQELKPKITKLITELNQQMSKYNRHGAGYAAVDNKGVQWGEKWIKNDQFLKPGDSSAYERFGGVYKPLDEASAILTHARIATTGGINIANTHPFFDSKDNPSVTLIHNGGIRNHGEFTKKFSTCDSEILLTEYEKRKIGQDVNAIKGLTDSLRGWYAVAVLKTIDGDSFVDLFTDGTSLYSGQLAGGGTIFCTNDDIIKSACKSNNVELASNPARHEAHTITRLNLLGDIVDEITYRTAA